MKLEIRNATCGYGKRDIVSEVSLSVASGEALCILGPNGVGKTTFFKTIFGFLKLKRGEILLNDRDIFTWSRRQLSKVIGYVPQAHVPPFPFKVLDVVAMGRTAHVGMFSSPSRKDMEIAEKALFDLDIDFLRDKIYTEISGGERQMVLIARALTQEAELLIMDEPTSNLDFGNQVKILNEISQLTKKGKGVIMTSHFPDHAFICSSKVAVMNRGKIYCTGTPQEVITEQCLKEVYGVNVMIIETPMDNGVGVKTCIPILG